MPCIEFLNQKQVKNSVLSRTDIKLSSITVAELYFGAEKSNAKKKNQAIVEDFIHNFEQIPFDNKCCRNYAEIRSFLQKKGTPIGPMDMLIASISLSHHLTLVTNNVKEFKRVKGLIIEDWI